LLSSRLSSPTRAHARAQSVRAVALLIAALLAASAAIGPRATAAPYMPPDGKIFVGVTGGRTVGGYSRAAGKPPAVFQFFVAWNDRFRYAYRRADAAGAGLMLHLSTYNGPGTRERIAPRDIALGRGDSYLLSLGRRLADYGHPVYLRLLSEMDNAENPYCAYGATGRPRGTAHAAGWFRQAWRRSYLILKGGSVKTIDARLRAIGLPRVRHLPATLNGLAPVRWLPQPKVAVQWTPMTAGSPDIPANGPEQYWPGSAYVDWVGTDFYSRFPNFSGLDRFYHDARWAGKPFVFGEWAMWGRDDPGFMRRFFAWVAAHPRVRMLAYNQGNRPTSAFRLYRYPRSARVMRRALRSARYSGRGPGRPQSLLRGGQAAPVQRLHSTGPALNVQMQLRRPAPELALHVSEPLPLGIGLVFAEARAVLDQVRVG
jgi:hypothetical protein